MGKSKKGSRFTEKSHDDNYDMEKLQAYAERMGKQIWEVSMDQLEEEEEEIEEQSEEVEDDQDQENKDLEIENEKVIQSHQNHLQENNIIKGNSKVNPQINFNVDVDITSDNKFESAKLNKEDILNQAGIKNTSSLEDGSIQTDLKEIEEKFPIVLKIKEDITKIVDKSEIENINEPNQFNTRQVKFNSERVLYEYPREDRSTLNANVGKKKKKKQEEIESVNTYEKPDKKKKNKKDLEEVFDEEELQRLEEARRRREEFAYLEKLRLEEEEEKKKLEMGKPAEDKKVKDKNKYKPKPKKKKGK